MKRLAVISAALLLMIGLCAGVFSVSANEASDPSEIYQPQTATYEDASIKMWFEHSFKKVMTSDVIPSDMDTYSVYMGKNEIENAQFVLYSDETKENMSASISAFSDGNGNEVEAEIYYQMYITMENLNTLAYPGATEENTFIRNGEQPDPMVPLDEIKTFQLNGGKSQAFYIRLKTTEDSASGWYSAQLNINNSEGQTVKTATVYAYVWNFTIEEKTALKTAFYLDGKFDSYGSYQEYYDYLLENRILGMDVPGALDSSNPYLTNDRVNAIRVTSNMGGNWANYMDFTTDNYPVYRDIYLDISTMDEWQNIKDKFYFYTLDEALSKEYIDTTGRGKGTIDDVIERSELLDLYWPNAGKMIPYHENHPYPYYTYDGPIADQDVTTIKDGVEAMIESESCTVWCPQFYGFTPVEEILSHDYDQNRSDAPIRTLSGVRSGNILYGEDYFNWEGVFGDLRDRIISANIVRNRDENNNDELWTYSAGYNSGYAYANHLIDNTGLQTKMLFWQLYQLDVTGYLYYGANFWNEYDSINGNYTDTTVTGNRKVSWKINLHPTYADGHPVYGNGMLFYKSSMGYIYTVDYIGSVRVELMRDGIEEYQMLTMLEKLEGDKAADAIVNSVSKNVINYISLPEFDRSAFSDEMDDYDVLAMKRIELGNQLEAATRSVCTHSYGEGVVTKEATCLELGEMSYTCADCGAVKIENIPSHHATDDYWMSKKVAYASCSAEGKYMHRCKLCGYIKYTVIPSYHDDKDFLHHGADPKNPEVHIITCPYCFNQLAREKHAFSAEHTNTCVEAGEHNNVCVYCGHTEKVGELEPLGHSYVYGVCETCGEVDPDFDVPAAELGDIDGSGTINSVDLFKLKLFVKQTVTPTSEEYAAADVNGDDKVNTVDIFYLKFRILKGYWA